MVAKDDECTRVGASIQPGEFRWNGSHRDQFGIFDASDGKFGRFPDVDQCDFFARIQPALYFLRQNFQGQIRLNHK